MNSQEILETLRPHKQTLKERFGVEWLAIFGAFARDQATNESNIEILVKFNAPATPDSYFGVQFFIEDLLGRGVYLVTDKALRTELRPYVERERVNV